MCLIIAKPTGIEFTESLLSDFLDATTYNPDGFGLAMVSKGKVVVKVAMAVDELCLDTYLDTSQAMVLHARFATNGDKTLDNCHPFKINGYAIAHNGIIDKPYMDYALSDTKQYIQQELQHYIPRLNVDLSLQHRIERDLGAYNKIVILDKYDNIRIINEPSGHWSNGVWFSSPSAPTVWEYAWDYTQWELEDLEAWSR